MKGNVNPFEPWRPVEARVPPPLHAGRPWRPPAPPPTHTATEEPLLVEPVDPPSRNKPPERPRCRDRREAKPPRAPKNRCARTEAGPPSRPSTPARQLRTDERMVVGMLLLLGVLGLIGLASLGGTHFLRVAATVLAVAIGFTVGISTARRRAWSVRLGWMAAGLALAGVALWFVPTLRGVNLWSAYRQVDELRTLPAGSVAEYRNGVPGRKLLVQEFPSFAPDVYAAEQTWLRRTIDEAIENAEQRMEDDPHAALADLQQLNTALAGLDHSSLAQKEQELEAVRRRAVRACAKLARNEAEDLAGKKQFAAVARRDAGPEQGEPERLLPKRREALTANLESARNTFLELLRKDDHRAIAALGDRLSKELGEEAKAVGMSEQLEDFCLGCKVFGDLNRQAEQR